MDGNGNAFAVWVQLNGSGLGDVWANRYAAGSGWGAAEQIETDIVGDAFRPEISVDGSGNAFAVWDQFDAQNIWSNRYLVGGGWGTAEVINTAIGSSQSPRIAADANGNTLAVWQQSDVNGFDIWANRYVAGSGWGTPGQIETDESGSAYDPQVAVDGYGNMVSVWYQFDGTRDGIYYNRFGGGGEPGGTLIPDAFFSDPFLGACVQAAAAANSWQFTQEVTALDCSQTDIRLLGGVQKLINLQSLNLSGTLVSKLDRLGGLGSLTTLDLSSMPNLSGVQALLPLSGLAALNLSGSAPGVLECANLDALTGSGVAVTPPATCRERIADVVFTDAAMQYCVTAAAAVAQLAFTDEVINLDCSRDVSSPIPVINQLDDLLNFPNLESVAFSRHNVSDITPLSQLPRLRSVDASSRYVTDLTPLGQLPALEAVTIKSDPLLQSTALSIDVLLGIPSLKAVYLNEQDACSGDTNLCVTGAGQLDCEQLDLLAAGLEAFTPPRSCNMPIANVVFADPNLEQCVAEIALARNYTVTEQVTDLSCSNRGITRLDGLERFGRLVALDVSNNPMIQDLSPLGWIYQLTSLLVDGTDITDFQALSKLDRLVAVFARNIAGLQDVTTLATMTRLTRVELNGSGSAGGVSCADLATLEATVLANTGSIVGYVAPLGCDLQPITPQEQSTDIDFDGDDDLVLEYAPASAAVTASWELALADTNQFLFGGTLPGLSTAAYSKATAIGFADADGDFQDDLLLQRDAASDGSVSWQVRLSGNGSYIGSISRPAGNDARAVAFNDIDDDGFADILIQEQLNGFVDYYVSWGAGPSPYSTLTPIYSFDLTLGRPQVVALEDLNNDGTADLVFDVWLGNRHCFVPRAYRNGAFEPQPVSSDCYAFDAPPNWIISAAGVADLDGNERMELVVSVRYSERSHVWEDLTLVDGPNGSKWGLMDLLAYERSESGVQRSNRAIAVTDLNSDGRADLLIEATEGANRTWVAHLALPNGTLRPAGLADGTLQLPDPRAARLQQRRSARPAAQLYQCHHWRSGALCAAEPTDCLQQHFFHVARGCGKSQGRRPRRGRAHLARERLQRPGGLDRDPRIRRISP